MAEVINDGRWFRGLDSFNDQGALQQGDYAWSQNIINRGGIISTRQGIAEIASVLNQEPKGIIVFTPTNGVSQLIVAAGTQVYHTSFPLVASPVLTAIPGITISSLARSVQFEIAIQAIDENFVAVNPPKTWLFIQDGLSSCAAWDGTTVKILNAANHDTPIGSYMKWAGDRLWIGSGLKVHASDPLNPLKFNEEVVEASGGFFFLPATITGMGVTNDYKSLLVFTDQTTSAFQVGIEDRSQWSITQDFQRVIFPTIGCASHRTIINQYGMTWWMSHDGLVALDSALQAYQTSRLHTRDQNMSRSKSGILSWLGGGCSGSFGNFLLFSVPSGNRHNVHTWVMDQGVVDTLALQSPPAWASNWTGIRPEQWTTTVVNGVQRCFCISRDFVPEGFQATVWEAFIGQRRDAPRVGDVRQAKDIACAFETKLMQLSPVQYARFRMAELDLAEINGSVDLEVFAFGRRTGYKSVLKKKLNARVGTATIPLTPDTPIGSLVPQYRTVRSVTDQHMPDDNDSEVQTPYIRIRDREFGLLVVWTGSMSILGVRIAVDTDGDSSEGVPEEDEITSREIDAFGVGEVTTDPVPPNALTSSIQSQYLAVNTPKWVEFPAYDSAVPNGVFFVIEPEFFPAPGGYPSNLYPAHITVSTETTNATISYTTDGSIPTLTHGTIVQDSTASATVPMNHTLKVRAFREGLTPSVLVSGLYSQAQIITPTITPPGGNYPSTDFPKSILVATLSAGTTIKYTLDGSTPSRSHGATINNYFGNVSVPINKTLKAMAYRDNYLDSLVVTGTYHGETPVATPTIIPAGGNQSSFPFDATVATSTNGAYLRYTLDGTTPTDSVGTPITANHGTVAITQGLTLKIVGYKAGWTTSPVATAVYTTKAATPTFLPPGEDTGNANINVVIQSQTGGVQISYISGLNPDNPTPDHGTIINNGDTISVHTTQLGTTVKAVAFGPGLVTSDIGQATYTREHP